MYPSKIILLLSHVFFPVPTESNPLLLPTQFLKAGYPEDIQMQRKMPGIVSYGSVFIGSMNNGIQITELRNGPENGFFKGMNCKEGCQQPQNLTEPFHGLDNPLLSGSLVTAGLSSTEIFLAQAIEIAKAKEKEKAGHFPFTTEIHESGGKDKPITAVKLPNRPKPTIPTGVQSEAISFVVNEPYQLSGKTPEDPSEKNTSVIYSHGGQLGMENNEYKVLPIISSPGVQENILFSKVIQPIIMPCQLKDLTEGPQQQTTTTGDYTAYTLTTTGSSTTDYVPYSSTTTTPTNVAYSTTNSQITRPSILQTTAVSASTKEPRNLRLAATSKSFKLSTTQPAEQDTKATHV